MENNKKFQQLLNEYHNIKEKHDALFLQITNKFAGIGANISEDNPTDKELSEWDLLKKSLQSIEDRIHDYCKNNI